MTATASSRCWTSACRRRRSRAISPGKGRSSERRSTSRPSRSKSKAVPQTDQYAIGVVLYVCLDEVPSLPGPRELQPAARDRRRKVSAAVDVAAGAAGEARGGSSCARCGRFPNSGSSRSRRSGASCWSSPARRRARNGGRTTSTTGFKAPPKASTHAMPLIEAMARGVARRSRPRWTCSRTERSSIRSGLPRCRPRRRVPPTARRAAPTPHAHARPTPGRDGERQADWAGPRRCGKRRRQPQRRETPGEVAVRRGGAPWC